MRTRGENRKPSRSEGINSRLMMDQEDPADMDGCP